jgi:uncharacterized phage-associated protein
METRTKLTELILYLCLRSESDEAFGAVKLNKLLFFSDRASFLERGHSITGGEYEKQEFGPVPKNIRELVDEMSRAGDVIEVERTYHGYPQKRLVARREADLSLFCAEEIALVEKQLQRFWGVSGRAISELSHELLPWRLARKGDPIPIESVLLEARALTETERQWAEEIDMSDVAALLAA